MRAIAGLPVDGVFFRKGRKKTTTGGLSYPAAAECIDSGQQMRHLSQGKAKLPARKPGG
jgi:hypothetical protein